MCNVDTLHFKIFDLSYHSHLTSYLLEKSNKKKTVRVLETDEHTGKTIAKNKMRFKYHMYHDTLKVNVVTTHFTEIKSNHYSIHTRVDMDKDCIHVNVSLPKYFHQTNVFQLIPHIYDKGYYNFLSNPPQESFEQSYELFRVLFTNFIDRVFPDINMNLVEFERIDFCYNQVFDSKDDAIRYLTYIQTKRKSHQRDRVNEPVSYGQDGFSYVTKDYSFKAYHKGTEFWKNDAKELAEINKKLKKERFNIATIGELADRTVRYELTSRLKNLNYVYNHRYFFQETDYAFAYSDWLTYKNDQQALRNLDVNQRKIVKQNIKTIDNFKNRVRNVVLQQPSWIEPDKRIVLDKNAFSVYLNYFWEMVKEFQIEDQYGQFLEITKLLETADFEQKLKEKNIYKRTNDKSAGIVKHKLILLMDLLSRYTMDEIRKKGLFPKSTFYRYLHFLERFGVTKNAHFGISIKAPLDHRNYYQFIQYNNFSHLKMYPLY